LLERRRMTETFDLEVKRCVQGATCAKNVSRLHHLPQHYGCNGASVGTKS
jgi:hypothetical protein